MYTLEMFALIAYSLHSDNEVGFVIDLFLLGDYLTQTDNETWQL